MDNKQYFTPRDYVRLLGLLAIEPIKDKLADNTYTIYDGALRKHMIPSMLFAMVTSK